MLFIQLWKKTFRSFFLVCCYVLSKLFFSRVTFAIVVFVVVVLPDSVQEVMVYERRGGPQRVSHSTHADG